MKKSFKLFILFVLLIIFGILLFRFLNTSALQGRLTVNPGDFSNFRFRNNYFTVQLSKDSPSGRRDVAYNDVIAIYDICSNPRNRQDIVVSGLNVAFRGMLKNNSPFWTYGYEDPEYIAKTYGVSYLETQMAFVDGGDIVIPAGKCKSVDIVMDTASMMWPSGGDAFLYAELQNVRADTDFAESKTEFPVKSNPLYY